MTRRWIGCSLAVVALVLVGCSSSGDGGATASLPADLATAPPDAGPEATAPPLEAPEAEAPEAEGPVDATLPDVAEEPAATPEEEAPVDEDGESTWWVWALLIAAVVAVIAVVAASAGRRRRAATQWRTDARAALDEIDHLTMQLEMATPESIGPVAADASARLATVGFSLQRLVDAAPDDAGRTALAQVQGPLMNVRELVDSIALSPTPPTANTVEVLRARASSLHATSTAARSALDAG
jgi:hypothetical protein